MTKQSERESKLAKLLSKHGLRYEWSGTWPAIPVALNGFDPVTTDALPRWVSVIRERIFEIVLPLKKSMSLEFYDAAIFGYAFSAMRRELSERRNDPKTLQQAKDLAAETRQQIEEANQKLSKEDQVNPDDFSCSEAKALNELLLGLEGAYAPAIAQCELKRAESQATRKGFDYGVQCQERESRWVYSSRNSKALKLTTLTAHIYEALLRQWRQIDRLTKQHRTSKEIADYLATVTIDHDGVSYAERFAHEEQRTLAQYAKDRVRITEMIRDAAETYSGKAEFAENVKQICKRLSIPLPRRGRPAH